MVALSKTKEITYNANLVQNKSHIKISRINDPKKLVYLDWKNYDDIHWKEYEIKETDMRQKTATFTSPNYFDLTTGVYAVLITSPYHANFGGVILSVEYDEDTGLYDYKCQDFSRFYQTKVFLQTKKVKLYHILQHLISQGVISVAKKPKKSELKKIKNTLSGLRPASYYDQKLAGSTISFNPMTQKVSIRAKGKSYIELIRDLVFGTGAYIDVYFDIHGVLQVVPYHKNDLFKSGLHLTTQEIANRKFSFDTTNIITGVNILDDGDKSKRYSAKDLTNVDLSAFFGNLYSFIDNTSTSSTKSNKNNSKKQSTTTVNSDNPYGTKNKVVYMNIDSIDGDSSDQNKMDKMCDLLKKQGWECHTCGVGSESHYARRGEVYGGIWFTLYGGACAGTLYETCTNNWYRSPLVSHGSRTVVGFFPPAGDIREGGKYHDWLPRAHDDGFSSYNFTGISHMADMLTKCAVPFMYANNPAQMVAKFLKGGDNPEACTNNWKFYSR